MPKCWVSTLEEKEIRFDAISQCNRGKILVIFQQGEQAQCSTSMLLSSRLLLKRCSAGEKKIHLEDLPGGIKTFSILERYVNGETFKLTLADALDLLPAMQTLDFNPTPLGHECRAMLRSNALSSWRTIVRTLSTFHDRLRQPDVEDIVVECRRKMVEFLEGVSSTDEVAEMLKTFMRCKKSQNKETIEILELAKERAPKPLALNKVLVEGLVKLFSRGRQDAKNKPLVLHLFAELMKNPCPRPSSNGGGLHNLAAFLAVALAPLTKARMELVEIYSRIVSELDAEEIAKLDPVTVLEMIMPWRDLDESLKFVEGVFAAGKRYVCYIHEQDPRGTGRNKHFRKVAFLVGYVCSSSTDESSEEQGMKVKRATGASIEPLIISSDATSYDSSSRISVESKARKAPRTRSNSKRARY